MKWLRTFMVDGDQILFMKSLKPSPHIVVWIYDEEAGAVEHAVPFDPNDIGIAAMERSFASLNIDAARHFLEVVREQSDALKEHAKHHATKSEIPSG